jgi:fructose-1,6-bisphosphatase/inositol monophosphatase family enzyme
VCDLLSTASAAARGAGNVLKAYAGRGAQGVRRKDAAGELVSDADLAAEARIVATIRRRYPDDPILSEEAGALSGHGGRRRWIVDPLDGSGNFLAGVPLWAVSVAVEEYGAASAGVVHDPMRDECSAATAGGVARSHGEPIGGSSCTDLGEAVVATPPSLAAALCAYIETGGRP